MVKSVLGSLAIILTFVVTSSQAQITFTGSYSENFDSMGPSGTTTPTGWFVGTGTNDTVAAMTGTTVVVDNGFSGDGGNKNYGTTLHPDRALGSLASAGLVRLTDLAAVNGTGQAISSFDILWDGEQWRVGALTSVTNFLTMLFSPDGTTWETMSSEFASPVPSGTARPLNGNDPANRTAGIGETFTPSTPIAAGATFYLRWADQDSFSRDNGLAIDNFSLVPEPNAIAMLLAGFGALIGLNRSRRRT
jgi:hypothetical protein